MSFDPNNLVGMETTKPKAVTKPPAKSQPIVVDDGQKISSTSYLLFLFFLCILASLVMPANSSAITSISKML